MFEVSGGSGWIMGNEPFDHCRTWMGWIMRDGLAGRPLGEAEPKGANKRAAMQIRSAGLKLATAMAQARCSTLLSMRQEMAQGENFLKRFSGTSRNICKDLFQHSH